MTRQHPISNEVANEQVRTSQIPVNNNQSVCDEVFAPKVQTEAQVLLVRPGTSGLEGAEPQT